MKCLTWGVLGTSFISGVMVKAIQQEGRSKVLAVAGRDLSRLTDFANEYDIVKRYQDYDELIEDSDVDIIYIALPNHLHHEYSVKAAKAGKAIVCEKSLSIDMQKTGAIDKHCRNVFFAEGLMYLNHPLIKELLALIQSPQFGTLKSIESHYVASIEQFVNPDSKGALFNLGCYPVSLAYVILKQSCTDEELRHNYTLTAQGVRGDDGNICDSSMQLKFSNGVCLRVHTAENYGLHHGFTLLGSNGFVRLVTNPWLPEGENNVIEFGEYEQTVKQLVVRGEGDGFYYQVKHVIDSVQGGSLALPAPSASLDDSIHIMALLCDWHDAAMDSIA